MIISIASGKGGTGKTTVATSLAFSLLDEVGASDIAFVDCDVEAPNAHLFLNPTLRTSRAVNLMVPQIDDAKCNYCGDCAQACQYHALAVFSENVMVFPQLCHGCGSCTLVCTQDAISEVPHAIGFIEGGQAQAGFCFWRGILEIGEPMANPIIRELHHTVGDAAERVVIRDAPPGASCSVVESLRASDFVLLVTEPTPFGLHDLDLAAKVAKEMHLPAGVIVNRDENGFPALEEYCARENLPILMRIPFDRKIAEGTAQGRLLVDIHPDYKAKFLGVFHQIRKLLALPESGRVN